MKRAVRDEWAKRVERWLRSGLTRKAFAAQAGLNANTLSYWKWRLGAEGRRARLGAGHARGVARGFLEVVTPRVIVEDAGRAGGDGVEAAEVVLVDGLRIRVPPRFDALALARMVAALEQR